ncbi:hypothetical protein FRA_33c05390 [Francisella sp. W12-1067]|nr:hypothetical protein FRA_33c05390 [Francisella sp. W12-1067]
MNEYKTLSYSELLAHKDEECCICQDLIYHNKSKKDARACETTCCKRLLHIVCIESWLFANSTCPYCRAVCTSPLTEMRYDYKARLPEAPFQNLSDCQAWFKEIINAIIPTYFQTAFWGKYTELKVGVDEPLSVKNIKKAIQIATDEYLEWRKNRGVINFFRHNGNKGIVRANTFNNEIQNWKYDKYSSSDPNNLFNLICKKIERFPRKAHSYTSFILNTLCNIEPIADHITLHCHTYKDYNDYGWFQGYGICDFTSETQIARDARNELLSGKLLDIFNQLPTSKKCKEIKKQYHNLLYAKIFGNVDCIKKFWRICFGKDLSSGSSQYLHLENIFTNNRSLNISGKILNPSSTQLSLSDNTDFIIIVANNFDDYSSLYGAINNCGNLPIVCVIPL